jgi:hypothetical protein
MRAVLCGLALAWASATSAQEGGELREKSWGTYAGQTLLPGFELRAARPDRESGVHLEKRVAGTFCVVSTFPDENPLVDHVAYAQIRVPEGAALQQFQYWAYDDLDDYGLTFDLYETCQSPDFVPPSTALVTSADTFGAIGHVFGFKPLDGWPVKKDCIYTVRVTFGPSSVACQSDHLQVQKMLVYWTRQVSPAPPMATFGDVPTSHPFFQFVEALAKSGITGGCGGGSFCPDAALTRGQMAVFLAKALGLQWP